MDYKAFYLACLRRLEPTFARSKFLTWFRSTAVLGIEGEVLTLGCPSTFIAETLRSKYAIKILQAATEENPQVKDIEFVVDALLADPTDPRTVNLETVFAKPGDKKVRRVAGTTEIKVTAEGLRSARLNPRYTLANFIPGEENRLAHAAALSVARAPGRTYNPLFVYGAVGLGKTHLLSAIGHEVLQSDPSKVVVYATAETFTNEFVAASRSRDLTSFKRRYRSADVFLIDDIQFLEDRTATQEELFNIFNILHDSGKQIVVTSDRPPAELSGIMARLQSRLTWGLVTEIEQPSYHSRLAILRAKTQERRAILDPELLEFIALNVTDSIRGLEGTLVSVLAQVDLLHIQPTVRDLGRLLSKLNRRERVVGLPESAASATVRSADELIQLVADYFRLPVTDLTGPCRQKEYQVARQIAMYLLREVLGMGLAAIAKHFARNHATVLHSCRRVVTQLKKDESLVRQLNGVKKELGL